MLRKTLLNVFMCPTCISCFKKNKKIEEPFQKLGSAPQKSYKLCPFFHKFNTPTYSLFLTLRQVKEMSLPYSTGQQNKSDKKSLEKASEKVTHAFGRTKIFSTSYNSAYFPSVSLSEDTSGCPLYLLSQRKRRQ